MRLVASLDDGTYVVEHADGRLERVKDETDWARLKAMTEEEIEAAARADPEWEGLLDIDWSKAELVYPRRKEAISIRLDEDVLSYFKSLGTGYQTRINAVLRSFMEQARAKRK
ncbi:MAG: BrnA antitoxin family protein [Methyloceanibacter sp.]|uniref:BrnA antitoxin family protein n=1 Tax=Methyloceanibacter sp. TaxID=1965321 RepID=UPI003D6CD31C